MIDQYKTLSDPKSKFKKSKWKTKKLNLSHDVLTEKMNYPKIYKHDNDDSLIDLEYIEKDP